MFFSIFISYILICRETTTTFICVRPFYTAVFYFPIVRTIVQLLNGYSPVAYTQKYNIRNNEASLETVINGYTLIRNR